MGVTETEVVSGLCLERELKAHSQVELGLWALGGRTFFSLHLHPEGRTLPDMNKYLINIC